ncbi:MAG: phosphoesterase, PA-phosphatase related protein [Polaromonas sp.]|nr:phosphoesterase, PA-phosphatase related protein [Polaromonas sp.]
MNPTTSPPWYRVAGRLVLSHVLLKALGTMVFIAVFFGAYFYLLKHPTSPPMVMQLTWADRLITFQPWTLPLYLSLWVYVSLPPVLLASRRELYSYGAAIAFTCLAGLAVFYVWPTAVPAADIDWGLYPGMGFLKDMDASGNAFPSLHVATAVFSGLWLHYLLRRIGTPPAVLVVNALWGVGIVYSTLATRQHVATDVAAGLVLGGLAGLFSVSRARARPSVEPARPHREFAKVPSP